MYDQEPTRKRACGVALHCRSGVDNFYAPHVVIVEESIFVPIAMLSLFVFSASTMSYLFLYEPLCLLLDGKRKEAVVLFFQTLGVFAASAVVLLLLGIFVLT